MAWIESHQSLRDHPKTRRLARMLGVSLPQAIGHLHCLWWWALDYAPDGDLSDYDAADIADAAQWSGDADAFVGALLRCGPGDNAGFLERIGDRLVLHDWDEYGNEYKEKHAAAERKRRSRARKLQSESESLCGSSDDSAPSRTRPVTGATPAHDIPVPAMGLARDSHVTVTQDIDKTETRQTSTPPIISPPPQEGGIALSKPAVSSGPTGSRPPNQPGTPPLLQLNAQDDEIAFLGRFFAVGKRQVEAWSDAFPAVDVLAEIRRAHAWVEADPRRRKVRWKRFLVGWLGRAQDRASVVPPIPPPRASPAQEMRRLMQPYTGSDDRGGW